MDPTRLALCPEDRRVAEPRAAAGAEVHHPFVLYAARGAELRGLDADRCADGSANRSADRRRGPIDRAPSRHGLACASEKADQQFDRSKDEGSDADERDRGDQEAHEPGHGEEGSNEHMAQDQTLPPEKALSGNEMKVPRLRLVRGMLGRLPTLPLHPHRHLVEDGG